VKNHIIAAKNKQLFHPENQGHISKTNKAVKSEIEFDIPIMITDLVLKSYRLEFPPVVAMDTNWNLECELTSSFKNIVYR
jgi:hypothetical protein